MPKLLATSQLPPRGKYARIWQAILREYHANPSDPRWYPVAPKTRESLQQVCSHLVADNWQRKRAQKPTSVGDIETYRDPEANLLYVRVKPKEKS